MKKRPILFSLAICFLTVSVMVTYFTMYSNVHGFDLFLNRSFSLELHETQMPTNTKAPSQTPNATQKPTEQATLTPAPIPTPTPIPEPTYTDISLSFIGDFLMHDNVLSAHYDSETEAYDFNGAFSETIHSIFKSA